MVKDLSILNRRGMASTDRKGVPWVYRCEFKFYRQDEDGVGVGTAVGGDFATTLKIDGCQNNWVMRNAAVKLHAAREKMFAKAGIRKSDRGAYAHEIRYGYDSHNDTWLVPIDGNGDAFVGGTWDLSEIITEDDQSMFPHLVGVGSDESGSISQSGLSLGFSYLSSRGTVAADSNLEVSNTPASNSIIRDMLAPSAVEIGTMDNLRAEAKDAQDNPPYDEFVVDDLNNDITEPVELGRAVCGIGSNQGSVVVDVPFGICGVRAVHHDAADTNVSHGGLMCVKVLDIYPMQG